MVIFPYKKKKNSIRPMQVHHLHATFFHLLHRHVSTIHHLKSLHAFSIISSLLSASPSLIFSLFRKSLTLFPNKPPPSLSYTLSLFDHLPYHTIFSFNSIIRAHTSSSLPVPALGFFLQSLRLDLKPDFHTFPFALKASSLLPPSFLHIGQSLHSLCIRFGFILDVFVVNTLLSMYLSFNSLNDACKIYESSPFKDVVSHNTLIDGFIKNGFLHKARKVFDEMVQRDVVSWSTLISGYANAANGTEGIALFDNMVEDGFFPDDIALVSALSCCAHLGALDRGRAIHHQYIKKNKKKLTVYLTSAMVDMYAKCGCITSAIEVFDACACKSTWTWNAIIVAVAMHGHGELAVNYFDRMVKEKVKPDGVTFVGVIVGCSHAGLVEKAKGLFNEMERVYGVERELKHYGCMADLYGRSGLVDEAMEMIEGMPMKADEYVWGAVLGGCRVGGNVGVAETAMERLFEIGGEDGGVYAIMMEVYMMAKRWDDVERMRKKVEEMKGRKSVACSLGCASPEHVDD